MLTKLNTLKQGQLQKKIFGEPNKMGAKYKVTKYKVPPRLNPSILNEIRGFILGEIV